MPDYRASINHMLVHLFNDILRIEETALRDSGISELSMREIHLLQAVMEAGDQNTMTSVAARLHVTVGCGEHAGAQGLPDAQSFCGGQAPYSSAFNVQGG